MGAAYQDCPSGQRPSKVKLKDNSSGPRFARPPRPQRGGTVLKNNPSTIAQPLAVEGRTDSLVAVERLSIPEIHYF